MAKNYKIALEQLVAELKNNPNINVLEFEINPPLAELPMAYTRLPAVYKNAFPQELIAIYQQMNGFKLVWEPVPTLKVGHNNWTLPWNYPPCYNELFPFEQIFTNQKDTVCWFEDEQEYSLDLAFHFFLDHDQEEQGGFLLGTNGQFDYYYLHNQGEDVDKLAVDTQGFFDELIAKKGFFCWQFWLIFNEFYTGYYNKDETQRSDKWFAALFDKR